MKRSSPTGRKNHGRPLKRLVDTWDRNGSTSGPTAWQIDDDDDDGDDDDDDYDDDLLTNAHLTFTVHDIDIDIDIFVNCSWVDTRWQYTFTHKQYTEQHN
jgi:hypothetical protein